MNTCMNRRNKVFYMRRLQYNTYMRLYRVSPEEWPPLLIIGFSPYLLSVDLNQINFL